VPYSGHQITVSPRLDADHAEAVLGVVVRDALDNTGQNFLGRRFRSLLQPTIHDVPSSAGSTLFDGETTAPTVPEGWVICVAWSS
jgi:hypothetical protein